MKVMRMMHEVQSVIKGGFMMISEVIIVRRGRDDFAWSNRYLLSTGVYLVLLRGLTNGGKHP